MIKRPSPGDTEQDILKMQSDFLLEQYKDKSFEPAAKVVKVERAKTKEPSNFAKKRAAMRLNQAAHALPSSAADDPLIPPTTPTSADAAAAVVTSEYSPIIGNIVERNTRASTGNVRHTVAPDHGFPQPQRLNRIGLAEGTSKQSLFALSRSDAAGRNSEPIRADVVEAMVTDTNETQPPCSVFGDKSYILKSKLASEIHEENVQQLTQLGEKQLLEERRQLLESMDPDLVKFLQSKRHVKPPVAPLTESLPQSEAPKSPPADCVENSATLDILNDPNYAHWPNFDVIEPAKLEWMRDVQQKLPDLKPGEAFEARFDWKGILLPYALVASADASDADDRDLYLHGQDAQRPGYTLQELFRLARSKVMQQRIAALGAISGLLSIYNQGFYDAVLAVPVSKCFFLLRFAFDENVPAIVEVSAKALATLLHNDADEILLDFTRDCSVDFREPIHIVRAPGPAKGTDDDDVERKFAQMHLNSQKHQPAMQANVKEDEDAENESNRESLNDFHLAEIDLVECLLRSNIVKRINYVLFTLRPDNYTVHSCLKVLIRLARSGESVVETLFADDLLRNVCTAFLPPLGGAEAHRETRSLFYGRPQYMALKLVRCVAAYGREWCDRVLAWGMWDVLKSYVFVRDDIKVELIKLQIEAFRFAKVVILSHMRSQMYNEITPALRYMLEWCYQFLQFERTSHLLIRQHAAALLTLISSMGAHVDAVQFTDKLQLCCSKWFHQATVQGADEFSQHMLLATCVNACTRISGDGFHAFYAQYLGGFLRSPHYGRICGDLVQQSPLLRAITRRPNGHEALPHLHSVVVNEKTRAPDYVYGQQYAVHLLTSIVNLLAALHAGQHRRLLADLLQALWQPEAGLAGYFAQLAGRPWNEQMRGNWFVRNELALLAAVLKQPALRESRLSAATVLQLAYRVTTYLSEDQVEEVIQLFEAVLFEPGHLNVDGIRFDDSELMPYIELYQTICFAHYEMADDTGLMVSNHQQPALPANWPCAPMLNMLRDIMQPGSGVQPVEWTEADIIRIALQYMDALHAFGVSFMRPTEYLMTLMIAYLGKHCSFLRPDMRALMGRSVQQFFVAHIDTHFDFETTVLDGGTTFENLYLLLIDHFQGTSYGDAAFGALVMVPLAQRYAVRWRQLVWSEHLAVMRFVQTPEEALLGGGLTGYLEPAEKDVTQLKYYYQALHTMRFVAGSVAQRIAEHHLEVAARRRRRVGDENKMIE